ncbi:hypothetical protein YC2023_101881 [Brassica napus]
MVEHRWGLPYEQREDDWKSPYNGGRLQEQKTTESENEADDTNRLTRTLQTDELNVNGDFNLKASFVEIARSPL